MPLDIIKIRIASQQTATLKAAARKRTRATKHSILSHKENKIEKLSGAIEAGKRKNSPLPEGRGCLKEIAAATYFPTQSPVQYHRRGEA
jgi:lipid II:glycine glycyltransferase (peptidoglycan interpeptide bridge formation enzyme)